MTTAQPEVLSPRSRPETSAQVRGRLLRTLAPLWTLLALGGFFAIVSDSFLNPVNLNNILVQASTLAILGTGMTFVLLTGEIDLSIAALVTWIGVLSAHFFANLNVGEPWVTTSALVVSTFMGLISGIATTRLRIPSFMATLAMSLIASGLAIWISQGRIVFELSPWVQYVGSGRIGGQNGIRVMTVLAALCLLIAFLVLRYTRFGRYVYMTGANKSAARLAGVNTDTIVIACLAISGFTAGLAGLVLTGRLASAQPQVINSLLIDTIGAVVLGGTSLAGGRGGVLQTIMGLLIYGTLRNGLDNIGRDFDPPLLGLTSIEPINQFAKDFITGVVLLFALVVNVLLAGRSSRDKTG